MPSKFRAIWDLAKGNRLMYGGAIVALVIASCFLYLAPLIPQMVIDGVIVRPADLEAIPAFNRRAMEAMGGPEFVARNLWWPGLLIVAFTALAGVFTYLRGKWSADASESIVRRVRDHVYDHLQHLPASYFDRAETGDIVQRCTSDVETLRTFLANQVVEIGRAVIMLMVPIPLMLAIDVRMTIASVVLLPPIIAFAIIFFGKIKAAFKDVDEAEGAMTTTIQENLTGIRVVRAFARQDFEREKFHEKNTSHRNLDYRLYRLFAWYWSISDLLCFLQKAVVVGAGAWWLSAGTLQVGAFFYFLTAVTMFIWPVRMMGRILSDLGKALVAMGRLNEILQEPREDTDELNPIPETEGSRIHSASPRENVRDGEEIRARKPSQLAAPAFEGEIVFDNVVFSHGEKSPVLRGISFRAKAGETLAILGPSGCGKSTIVNLLLRLYDYDEGEIRLDGMPLNRLPRKLVRSQMAVVMQEPFLYSKTLRENVKLGRSSARDEEMIEATTTACVHDSILTFEEKYDTMVGERGVTLSGGQRQRVALARALLQDPAILILDDALSAVDTETETMILDALRDRRGRHTSILIAHRLSTLKDADQIIVLDHGRMVQRGDHATLVAEEGLYRRLWLIQGAVETEIETEIAGAGASAN